MKPFHLSLLKAFLLLFFTTLILLVVFINLFWELVIGLMFQLSGIFWHDYGAYIDPDRPLLVDSGACRMLNWKIFDWQTKMLFVNHSGRTYPCGNPIKNKYHLINRGLEFDRIHLPPKLNCTARAIVRDINNNEVGTLGPQVEAFNSKSLTNDALQVECDKHFQVVPLIPKRQPKFLVTPSDYNRAVNILMIGIDSISRLQFHRHFPLTQALFEVRGFIPFVGHHKVGENTYPNLMAILTGQPGDSLKPSDSGKLDHYNLVYKEFSRLGYLTTYLEDWSDVGLFNYYGLRGFLETPVDYYLRPASTILEALADSIKCYQGRLQTEFYYDYILDQMIAFNERKQNFLIHSHMNCLSHDSSEEPGYLDAPVKRHLNKIFELALHRRTMIIFFADHGPRFGQITSAESFSYESSLPVLYIYLPEDLNLEGLASEQLQERAKRNSRRLTSHFDLHATLRHILHGKLPKDELIGRSLLTEIQENRTCKQAGIPENFCMCDLYQNHRDDRLAKLLSEFLVTTINTKLEPIRKRCSPVTFDSVVKFKIKIDLDYVSSHKTYQLDIKTQPNEATFHAKLLVANENSAIRLLGHIERLDSYAKHSVCVSESSLQRFCQCRTFASNFTERS